VAEPIAWSKREKKGDFAELMREIVGRQDVRVDGSVVTVNIARDLLTVWYIRKN
jgi:hypothetical protein